MTYSRCILGASALAALFGVVVSGSAAQTAGPMASPNKALARTLDSDGLTRTYLLYRPASLGPESRPPLVVVMHGYSGRASGVESHYHWDDEADRGGFVVVYPDGIERSWNSGNCCATAFVKKIDDVKFLTALVQRLESDEHVDPRRIFFSGMSNGGLMSYRMACEAKFPIAAIGPVGATLDIACPAPQQTSLISINGRADQMIPYDGGKNADPGNVGPAVQTWRVNLPAIDEVLVRWRALDGCGPPAIVKAPPVTTEIAGCRKQRTVEEIVIDGAGHQWPGGTPSDAAAVAKLAEQGIHLDPPSPALDATHTIWQFFSTKSSQ